MTNKELLEKIIESDKYFDYILESAKGGKLYAIHSICRKYEMEDKELLERFYESINIDNTEYLLEFIADTDIVDICENLRKYENIYALYDNFGSIIMYFAQDVYIEDGLVTDIDMEELEDLFKLNLREVELDFKFI